MGRSPKCRKRATRSSWLDEPQRTNPTAMPSAWRGIGFSSKTGLTDERDQQKSARLANKREAILVAATAIFLRYGFKKTSMDDVARAAGVSRQGPVISISIRRMSCSGRLFNI